MIYHIVGDPQPIMVGNKAQPFPQKPVQPILFLSKGLTEVESRQWPTELEMNGVVWVTRKIRHMLLYEDQVLRHQPFGSQEHRGAEVSYNRTDHLNHNSRSIMAQNSLSS